MHIHRIDRNKSPLQISEKVAVGVVRDSRKFFGHPHNRAHRAVIFAIAQLSCVSPSCLLLYEYLPCIYMGPCSAPQTQFVYNWILWNSWEDAKRKSKYNRAQEGDPGRDRQGAGCIGPPKRYKAGTVLDSYLENLPFLQRVSIACYAERCISYSKSVRPSVRPSHAGTESKRLKLRSWGLHWRIAPWL